MSYPVNLNVTGKPCLVVGGGKVGARKARGLQAEGADVTVLSSSFYEQIDGVTYIDARYDASYIDQLQPWLVVTCTDSHDTNAQIQQDADKIGAIVMRADDSKAGDAHGIMKRERDAVTVTAATGVPTLSRYLMDQVEGLLTPEFETLAREMAAIRADLRDELSTPEARGAAWRSITPHYEDWLKRLEAGQAVDLRAEVDQILKDNPPE